MDISGEISRIAQTSFEQPVNKPETDELAGDKNEAAERFESLLATMLVKEMRKTMDNGLFGEGAGSDIYSGWFDNHVGAALAQDGGFDLEGIIRVGIDSKIAAAEQGASEA